VESSLRLGLNPTLSSLLLDSIAQDLARRNIKLEVSFGGAHDLVRQVQTRQLDLALGFTPLPPHHAVEYLSLKRLPFVVLAASQCALAQSTRRSLRVRDLANQFFVDWLRDDPYGGANRARFESAGIQIREVARAESFLHLFEVIRAYKACAIAPDLRPLAPFPPDLKVWKLQEKESQAVEVVALWPSSSCSAEAKACLDLMKRRLKSR